MKQFLNKLMPFILLGTAIVVFIFGVMLFAYLLLFGALVGAVLFLVNWIRNKFFAPKVVVTKKPSGRIIDTDDWKKL